jgi:hypothetical protein
MLLVLKQSVPNMTRRLNTLVVVAVVVPAAAQSGM